MEKGKNSKKMKEDSSRIKKLRKKLKLTTREFAKLFGKSHSTIVFWENRQVEIPPIAIKLLEIYEKENSPEK